MIKKHNPFNKKTRDNGKKEEKTDKDWEFNAYIEYCLIEELGKNEEKEKRSCQSNVCSLNGKYITALELKGWMTKRVQQKGWQQCA